MGHCAKRPATPKIPPEAVALQSDFVDALLSDAPLLPGEGGWTVGDLIYLKAIVDTMIERVRQADLDSPLIEIVAQRPKAGG